MHWFYRSITCVGLTVGAEEIRRVAGHGVRKLLDLRLEILSLIVRWCTWFTPVLMRRQQWWIQGPTRHLINLTWRVNVCFVVTGTRQSKLSDMLQG
jgi:hypothetical protein